MDYGAIQDEWRAAASALDTDMRACLEAAVCVRIIDPVDGDQDFSAVLRPATKRTASQACPSTVISVSASSSTDWSCPLARSHSLSSVSTASRRVSVGSSRRAYSVSRRVSVDSVSSASSSSSINSTASASSAPNLNNKPLPRPPSRGGSWTKPLSPIRERTMPAETAAKWPWGARRVSPESGSPSRSTSVASLSAPTQAPPRHTSADPTSTASPTPVLKPAAGKPITSLPPHRIVSATASVSTPTPTPQPRPTPTRIPAPVPKTSSLGATRAVASATKAAASARTAAASAKSSTKSAASAALARCAAAAGERRGVIDRFLKA